MRYFIIAAAVLAAGCQKSVDARFADMCAYQERDDPSVYAMSKGACDGAEGLPDSAKQTMIDAYAELRKARDAVEDGK